MDISLMTNGALREILQSMSEGIILVEESGKIAIANLAAEQLFGYERDELKKMMLESLLPERDRGRHLSFRKGLK